MASRYLSIILIITCFVFALTAQQDSVALAPITISSTEILKDGKNHIHFDFELDEHINYNLDDLIRTNSSAYIKGNGFGSLSTLKVRGTSSGQNQVLWEGISIVNPMVAVADLSAIPVDLFDHASLELAHQTGVEGSGAIGANLNLSSRNSNKDPKALFLINYNSLGSSRYVAKLNYGIRKIKFKTSASGRYGDNNFTFTEGAFNKEIDNNYNNQIALLNTIEFRLSEQHKIGLKHWYQNKETGVPPTIFQNVSESFQRDHFNRIILDHLFRGKKTIVKTSLSYFDESIEFVDQIINFVAPSNWQVFQFQNTIAFNQSKYIKIKNRLGYRMVNASANNYSEEQDFNSFSNYFSLETDLADWNIKLGNRVELTNITNAYFIPDINIRYQISNSFYSSFHISRLFRVPGMNDLFWIQGGNIDLQNEQGWAQELNLFYNERKWECALSIYNRNVDNWIIWVPNQNGIWSATNIAKVDVQGIDLKIRKEFQIQHKTIWLSSSTSWNSAKNKTTIALPVINDGDQLIYSPQFLTNLQFGISNSRFSIELQYNYTSSSRGVNDIVDSFSIINTYFQYKIIPQKIRATLKVHNWFDDHYFIVERRPMPGRYYELGLNFRII